MSAEEIVLVSLVGIVLLANIYGWGKELIHWRRFKKIKKEVRGDDGYSSLSSLQEMQKGNHQEEHPQG